jgi:uncharacterized membrane protein YhhN
MKYRKFIVGLIAFILSFIVFSLLFRNWDFLKALIIGN